VGLPKIIMKILVTGGAGYIGGFMTEKLLDDGHEVVVADSLERGHEETIDTRAVVKKGNLCDKAFVASLFSNIKYDGVIHFAAYISMGESMQNPYLYFYNNIQASLNIIEEMREKNQNNFIFSSTAGVYGNPIQIPIPESHPKNPENPYGESKLQVEKILSWYAKTKNLSYVVLRYFNAAGAALDGSRGEGHTPESHIIPNIMRAILEKRSFNLFGNDYETPDGTCIRDYIHVLDLVNAHTLALQKLLTHPGAYSYNVGTGVGYSNKEVIDMVQQVSCQPVQIETVPRRPGDADMLVADVKAIQKDLQFAPQYSDLKTIVGSAWKWHAKTAK
jgi:UDP-glucose 4-epimerase